MDIKMINKIVKHAEVFSWFLMLLIWAWFLVEVTLRWADIL